MGNANVAQKLWDWIRGVAQKDANQFLYVPIPKQRTNRDYNDQPLRVYRDYFRLWLCEMFLAKSRQWFVNWHPAFHSTVELKFGSVNGVKFSQVAQAPEGALADGVLLDYQLTRELMPFNGGTVEIEAALLALQGANPLKASIKILQDFSELIVAPLAEVLKITEKVAAGMQELLAGANGQVHLPFHQTFVAGGGHRPLAPGYIAVIKATAAQLAADRLSVHDGRLHYAAQPGAPPAPLQGFDYFLLFIEGRDKRDDWRLKNIEEPLNRAIEAGQKGNAEDADTFKKAALAAAWTSPDLAVNDRRRVVKAIEDELAGVGGEGLGFQQEERDLNAIMAHRAMPVEAAAAYSEDVTLNEFLQRARQ